jgi:hypothetical protein
MVADDEICPGPPKRKKMLLKHSLFVEPSSSGTGFYHGIFAGNLIYSQRMGVAVPDIPDQIQVTGGRLYKEEIGPFGDILIHFSEGFPAIGYGQLMGAAISTEKSGAGLVSEGAVKMGGKLGCIAHECHIRGADSVEPLADGLNAKIEHIAGSDDVGPGLGMETSHLDKALNALIIIELADETRVE